MWRYLVGAVAALLLIGGGALWWRGAAVAGQGLPAAPSRAAPAGDADEETPDPPAASDKTREEKRFARYDRDKDGRVARDEYLAARRKAFARLDADGDGRLRFDEWAIKATTKFGAADGDRSGALTPAEFVATRVARKARAPVKCPPAKDDDA